MRGGGDVDYRGGHGDERGGEDDGAGGGTTVTLHSTVTGLIGSLESLASHFAHSDAVSVRPLDLSELKIVGVWFGVVVAMVYGAFAMRAY